MLGCTSSWVVLLRKGLSYPTIQPSWSLKSLYFWFMMGESSWVHSRTQGSIPMLFCRRADVLWLLHSLLVPSNGWWLDQGRWSLYLLFCFCVNDQQWHCMRLNVCVWYFQTMKLPLLENLVCNNLSNSDVCDEWCKLDVIVNGDRWTYYDLGCMYVCGLKSFEISRTTGIIWA